MKGTSVKWGLFLLAAIILASVVSSFTAAAEATKFGEYSADDFTYESRCRQCHAIIYGQWEGTMHFNAYLDPFYLEEVKVASIDTDGLVDEFCARCHTPIGVVSGEIPPIDGSGMSDISKLGVQCDFCHVISGSDGIGNAPFIITPGDIKWGPFEDSKSAYHDSEYLKLYTQAEYCGMCHEVIHPVNGLVIDDTYSTWKDSQYGKDNVVCQDCHMTEGITEYKANPGRSGSGAPKREHISLHAITGGNAFIPMIFGAEDVAKMATERLQNAATLEVRAPEVASAGEEVIIEVSITNSGAGHNIPTGVSEIRQIWLEMVVTDAEGHEIYSAGTLDTEGSIKSAKRIYNNVLGDSEGTATESFWLADRVLEDNRIGPEKTVEEKHTFILSEDVVYPLKVETSLNYRSASQELIDKLFEKGTYEVPVIQMNEASNTIYHPDASPKEGTEPTPGFSTFTATIALILRMYINRK
ncbi:multiheme c-type cytochrome [Methanolobus psychrotolerans]|uniref:multiheme c-type cytochrome n=1 Tax=Methanolobus psychrotolerans TaxID=1874706 RepID=UPI000B91C7E3|nr:multiheme c-type cytochrome [Methanolobus psychrotolerans]